MKTNFLLLFGLIFVALVLAVYFYPLLPEQIASHWNGVGEVNGWMPKLEFHFFVFGLLIFSVFLFLVIPKIDPLKKNLQEFIDYYWGFVYILVGFIVYTYLLTVAANLGFKFNTTQVLMPALAVLFFYLGVVMEKAKRNWFIGIRTPWTLSSDRVWNETHKIGAKLFKVIAIIFLLLTAFPSYAFTILITVILITVFSLIAYSYWLYYKLEK